MASTNNRATRRTLLLVSQVYVPDPASVGQHMHDAAAELARRGHRVIVYTARTGYTHARQRYPRREVRDGVEIRRLGLSSLGKRPMAVRLAGGMLFLAQATLRALFMRDLAGVLITTSPPMAPLLALALRAVRRTPFVFWVMDVNPDQAVAMGRARRSGPMTRLLAALIRATLRRARHVVALDRSMRDRLNAKVELGERISILAPWPHEDHVAPVPHAENPFRAAHGLEDKLVLMYSGNLSPAHPMRTVLEAAKRLRETAPEAIFLFVGDGLARPELEDFAKQEALTNVRFLPYQPLEQLHLSLSAADVHLVAMGEAMVGIVHPSKLYGAMAVARPVLLIGPRASHASEVLETHEFGWRIDHDDVDGAAATIQHIADLHRRQPDTLVAMGHRARQAVDAAYGKSTLCPAMADLIERELSLEGPRSTSH